MITEFEYFLVSGNDMKPQAGGIRRPSEDQHESASYRLGLRLVLFYVPAIFYRSKVENQLKNGMVLN